MSVPAHFPAKSLDEVHKMLNSPGSPYEVTKTLVNGREIKVYKNAPPSVRLVWLASKLGCRKGDRIAICSRNLPEWIFVYWATQLIGGITVAVNAWLPAESLRHCLTLTTPRVVFIDSERSPIVSKMLGEVDSVGGTRFVLSFRDSKAPSLGMLDFAKEMKDFEGRNVEKAPDVQTGPDEVITIYFTSGTTGLPKGVVGTSRQYIHNIINSTVNAARAYLRKGEAIPTPSPNDPQKSTLLAVPLFHAMGNHSALGLSTAIGAKIVMIRKWDAEHAADLIIKEKLSSAGGIPFMANEITAVLIKRGKLGLLEGVSWGGAASASGLPDQIGKLGASPGQGYGATEVSSMATGVVGEDYILRPTTAGLPCPPVDVKIVDPNTRKELPTGEHGEVLIAGPGVTNGYWRNEKATKEAFQEDGFYATGDIGYVDSDGFVYISDRVKDMIIRGGENIASISIENEIFKDDRVLDAAAVGVPDEKFGEVVAAAVVLKPSTRATESELIEFVRSNLPKHSVPVMIAFMDHLPRNGVGKTDKKILRTEVTKRWEEKKKSLSKL